MISIESDIWCHGISLILRCHGISLLQSSFKAAKIGSTKSSGHLTRGNAVFLLKCNKKSAQKTIRFITTAWGSMRSIYVYMGARCTFLVPPPLKGRNSPWLPWTINTVGQQALIVLWLVASAKSWAKRCHGHTFVRFSYTVKWRGKLYISIA